MAYGFGGGIHASREVVEKIRKRKAEKPDPKKRQRFVYPSNELPHLWAHKVQDKARGGNVFFEGDTIFSYGTHFPIARHVTSKRGKKPGVLFTTRTYSSSTSGHCSAVRSAIIPGTKVFDVPFVLGTWDRTDVHPANLKAYQSEITKKFEQAKRARSSGLWLIGTVEGLVSEANEYIKFFGLKADKLKLPLPPKQWKEFRAVHAEKKRISDEREAIKRAEYERKHAAELAAWNENAPARFAELMSKVEAWRNCTPGASIPHVDWRDRQREEFKLYEQRGALLRISSDNKDVETSMGARVPVSHAIRGLRLIRAVMKSGKEYQRNGHTEHLGNYAIDRIETNGTLHAGCHHIQWSEIALIAPELESLATDEAKKDELTEAARKLYPGI